MSRGAVTESEDASVRTVAVAVLANLLIAVAKGVAAVLTGSAAMLAETTHSVADTCNEVLLFVGVIYDGGRSLRHPEPVANVGVGVAVLLISAGLEGLSWRTAPVERAG